MLYRQIAIDAIDKTIAAANSSGMLNHKGLKGRLREIVIEELIKPFLSPHIKVATGVIVDSYGHQSRQIDIIIYDEQVTPPILFSENEGIVPCHSVLATIEVKSKLTKGELRKAVQNARSVKLLHYDYSNIPGSREVNYSRIIWQVLHLLPESKKREELIDILEKINSPASFVFAFTSNLSMKRARITEDNRLKEVVEECNNAGPKIEVPISGLCISDRVFHYCTSTEGPEFVGIAAEQHKPIDQDGLYRASHNVVLEFIYNLVNTCSTMASQRWRIPLDMYFKKGPETMGE